MEFFFDFVSPYAYFASTQIDALAARHGRQVAWKPTLIGVTILRVMGLKPLPQTPLKADYVAHDKPRMAQLLGIPFRQPDMTDVHSVAAARAYLVLAQQDDQLARRFAREIFERLWVRGLGITQTEDIAEACRTVGADPATGVAAMDSGAGRQALREAVDEAVRRSVFGTPFFIVDDEPIWGVDRLWMVEHWLRHGTWSPPPER